MQIAVGLYAISDPTPVIKEEFLITHKLKCFHVGEC